MRLQVLCDCDENKVCVGNFDGKPMWHYTHLYTFKSGKSCPESVVVQKNIKPYDWKKNDEWFKHEAYVANSD